MPAYFPDAEAGHEISGFLSSLRLVIIIMQMIAALSRGEALRRFMAHIGFIISQELNGDETSGLPRVEDYCDIIYAFTGGTHHGPHVAAVASNASDDFSINKKIASII